jgi:uncharacterized protein (TIGR00369 family)
MKLRDPDALRRVRALFEDCNYLSWLGVELVDCGAGWAETRLVVEPRHYQNQHYVHAGVQASLADHSSGAAAGTLVGASDVVLAAEFKINLIRPAEGQALRCRAEVIKAGRRLIFTEARVLAQREGDDDRLVATFGSTVAVVPAPAT